MEICSADCASMNQLWTIFQIALKMLTVHAIFYVRIYQPLELCRQFQCTYMKHGYHVFELTISLNTTSVSTASRLRVQHHFQ